MHPGRSAANDLQYTLKHQYIRAGSILFVRKLFDIAPLPLRKALGLSRIPAYQYRLPLCKDLGHITVFISIVYRPHGLI